jgi:hypothetical protein
MPLIEIKVFEDEFTTQQTRATRRSPKQSCDSPVSRCGARPG